MQMMDQKIIRLKELINHSKRLVFFGGAGVSTGSGIPDFRSDAGIYSEAPEMILSKEYFYLQPERFFEFYRRHMLHPEAKPNAVHRYLYDLEQRDILRGIVTQNVDGLHRAAGNIRVYELHGNVNENECMECGASYPMEAVLNSTGIPRCSCGGVIKPNVVLYGEPLPKYVCIGARREITNADTLIVAGTSLAVEPAASFVEDFRGRNLIVINKEATRADEKATLVIHEDVTKVFETKSRIIREVCL